MARTPLASAPLTRPDGSPIRVLAVDDGRLTELLSMAMRYEGWQVTTAGPAATPSGPPGRPVPTPSCWT